MTDDPLRADGDVRARVDRFLAGRFPGGEPVVTALSGDASDRRYLRVQTVSGSEVLAVHPGPIRFEALPFANVARLLHAMPAPAPRILAHSDSLGILALEDLGDLTLQAHLATTTPAERAVRYEEAVALVHLLQRRGAELASPDFVPYGLAFDVEKLTFELDFFVTHFLEGHRGSAPDTTTRAALATEFGAIVAELAAERRVLCHRDYHSRNLMLHDGRLYLIDFQDARMGPDTYDLASLLRDSYVELEPGEVDDLIARFLGARRPVEDPGAFRRRFDLMALQRNLKALGTFGFQASVRGNASYLEAVPRTLRYVRTTLAAYPRFARLRRLLAPSLPELG